MRLLLIEDDAALADALAAELRRTAFDVDVCADGNDGVWYAREGSYDGIVLDLQLPGMTGQAICRALRNEQVWTPILVLTAGTSGSDESDLLDLGADDYLTKPATVRVLVSRIRAMVRRAALPGAGGELVVGDLRIDGLRRECWRGSVKIPLTPREFSVLELLARNAGHTVPKSRMLTHVWGLEFDGTPAVVEVYVGYLRDKIDRPFSVSTIRTVRGVGYELTPG